MSPAPAIARIPPRTECRSRTTGGSLQPRAQNGTSWRGRNDRLERGVGLKVRLAQVARPICLGCYRTVELPTTGGDSLPVIHIAPMAESNNYD